MCKWGTHEKVKLMEIQLGGCNKEQHRKRAKILKLQEDEELIDSCIAPLVQALNDGGIKTRASCCGHGRPLGIIDLQDGRVILVDNRGEWITHAYRFLIKALWVHFIYPKRIWFRVRKDNLFWRLKNCLKKI